MQKAYLVSTIFLLSVMMISIIWVTIYDFLERKRKKDKKHGKMK